MFERLTDRARKVMALANQEAQRFNHEYIGTEHILLGLVKEGSGVGANVLKNLDIDLRKVRLEVEKLVKSGPDMVTMGKLPQTPRAKKVIEYAMEEARNLNHNYVGTEHLLLGLLREQEGVAAQVLMNLGLKLEDVREEVLNLLGAGVEGDEAERARGPQAEAPVAAGKSKTPALDSFGRDLTELAKQGELDPVIGRERDRTAHPGPLPPHQEQPRAARRGGRRQDGDRRGPRPADRRQARPRALWRQAHRRARPGDDGRGHEVPRPVRGAHQGGHERGPPREERHPVHRRTAHARRCRRRRRRDRRIERAQAGARPRRDPVHRCHDARRVPQVHREGRRAGAPVPDDHRRAADEGRDGRDPQGPARPLREHHRVQITDDALERRSSCPAATSPAAACPTRRST